MIIRMTRSTQLLFGTRSNELRELISRTAHLRKIQRSKYDKLDIRYRYQLIKYSYVSDRGGNGKTRETTTQK